MSRGWRRLPDGLYVEDVALAELAERFGTPLYVYSRQAIEEAFLAYRQALAGQPHLVCYAVKANSSLAVLQLLARLGAGFDIVSGGELARVLRAGGDPARVVFSGVAKTRDEMAQALAARILCFNVESTSELRRLDAVAGELGTRAPVSLRVNPDVDAKTHPYIATGLKENKFGIDFRDALEAYRLADSLPAIDVIGIDCHIGSQLLDAAPFVAAFERVLELRAALAAEGIALHHVDVGGGLGVCYRDERPPSAGDYLAQIRQRLDDPAVTLLVEPGRSIVANAGVLLTRVEYLKQAPERRFALVDAAMNDMIRPALYDAWLDIEPVRARPGPALRYDVVGPVCETGDFLGKQRDLCVEEGDLLAVGSAGAYGFSMSSNYNSRGRAAEVVVDGDEAHLVRRRETVEDLMRGETLLPE